MGIRVGADAKYDVLLPRARKLRARASTRIEGATGKKKYGHSPVECSKCKDKIHGWKYLRQNKGARLVSAGRIIGAIPPASAVLFLARAVEEVVYRVALKAPSDETA